MSSFLTLVCSWAYKYLPYTFLGLVDSVSLHFSRGANSGYALVVFNRNCDAMSVEHFLELYITYPRRASALNVITCCNTTLSVTFYFFYPQLISQTAKLPIRKSRSMSPQTWRGLIHMIVRTSTSSTFLWTWLRMSSETSLLRMVLLPMPLYSREYTSATCFDLFIPSPECLIPRLADAVLCTLKYLIVDPTV